jgi:hypothetical protein
MGLGGTKLERSNPWQSKSAIHSASFTSVLRPRYFLHVLRVGHHNLEGSFEDGVDRLPLHSRALHGYLRAAFRESPFVQAHQLSRGSAECPYLLLDFPLLQNDQQASDYRGLMHIQSTTTFHQSLHSTS